MLHQVADLGPDIAGIGQHLGLGNRFHQRGGDAGAALRVESISRFFPLRFGPFGPALLLLPVQLLPHLAGTIFVLFAHPINDGMKADVVHA